MQEKNVGNTEIEKCITILVLQFTSSNLKYTVRSRLKERRSRNATLICLNAHFKIHDVMHVASHRQLSVVDVNLFEASAPTKVKHATSALTILFKAEISYVRVNGANDANGTKDVDCVYELRKHAINYQIFTSNIVDELLFYDVQGKNINSSCI